MEVIIKSNVREVALLTLEQILYNDKFSNNEINNYIKKIEKQDEALFRKLVYGVVENKIYLDYIISKLSSIALKKINKKVINILRIAIYEIIFLNSKIYAVVNEAVNNTKKYNYKSKSFVNAILRNFERNKEELKIIDIKDKDEYLSIKYSVSKDIIEYLKKYYNDYEKIIEIFNETPKLNIRVNTLKNTKIELKEKLEKFGFNVKDSNIAKDSLIIENPINITEIEFFKNGDFTIQDQSSILVGEVLNPSKNSKVLDLCAAPGSKSTHIMQIIENTGELVSNDISFSKLDKIRENFDRLGLKLPNITNHDATKFINEFENKFDYVLVDAPCSGLGVIKRKPEIKLFKSLEKIYELSEIQYNILENSYKYLKNNGVLVYSTCTLGNLENRDVINRFLDNHKDMQIIKINENDFLEIPISIENDGFFICKMLKNK